MVDVKMHSFSHYAIFFTTLRPFPTEDSVEDEDIYNHLEDLIE